MINNPYITDITKLSVNTYGHRLPADTYFIDSRDRVVYSKKRGLLTRLYGTVDARGVRRYTLQVANPSWSLRSIKLKEQDLIDALGHYNAATKKVPVLTPSVPVAAKAATAPSKGWIIGNLENGSLAFSNSPRVHDTEASVNAEIERLARLHPGTKFAKLRIEAYVETGGLSWS